MKSINKFLITSCALLAMISCTREIDAPQANERPQEQVSGPALCDTDFIGVIDEVNGAWVPDAEVLVYDGVSEDPLKYHVSEISDDGQCVLSGQVFNTSDVYFAFYPSDGVSDFADGIVSVTVPAAQTAAADLICVSAAITTDSVFTFSPIASYIRLKVINDNVKSITISAAHGENLAGKYRTTVYEPELREVNNVSEEIVLSSGGDRIEKGEYYVQVLPGDYSAINMVVTYTDGTSYAGNRIEEDIHLGFGDVYEFGKVFEEYINAPAINVDQVAFSSARVTWPRSAQATGYNLWLDGQKVAELDGEASSHVLTDLALASTHSVSVEMLGENVSQRSMEQTFSTAGFRVVDKGRCHVTIEWDEVGQAYNGTAGSKDGSDRGYYIGIYRDAACTQVVYELCPYDALKSRWYGFSTSSYIGKKNGTNYYIPTRLALGSLTQDTEYYIRVRTIADVSYVYDGTTYTISHPYGTTEWSSPVCVRTDAAHQPADNEVIFEDFDELAVGPDRRANAPGTVPASYDITDHSDMRVISVGYLFFDMLSFGMAEQGTATSDAKHRDYYGGKYFNVDYSGNTTYDNYIVKEGYDLAGWHMSNNVRPAMGTIFIDRARNRMIGTPALTRNLSEEGTPCILTFDQCVFLNDSPKNDVVKIWIYRNGVLSDAIHSYTVTTDSYSWTDANNYVIDYKYTTKSFPLNLKSGDAVIIGTNNEGLENNIAIDNFRIVVSDESGSGSLEIPDWGDDDDDLEI